MMFLAMKFLVSSALLAANPVSNDARIIPAFENGRPVGYMVIQIVPGSAMQKTGFKDKDIVVEYNKKPANNNPALLTQMSQDVEKGSCAPIRVKRDKKLVELKCRKR